MIKIENHEVVGWEHAIRGMRNPMNSWEKSDSKQVTHVLRTKEVAPGVEQMYSEPIVPYTSVGYKDHELMMKLAKGGGVHAKYRRMITVYVDITAPLYWWKEFDTYKVGTVANSCSTMHTIHEKEITLEDFSHEHLHDGYLNTLKNMIPMLNCARKKYIELKDDPTSIGAVEAKDYWWQMIQLLPSSYNQKRTVMLNYEVLANIHKWRRNHKLDEWEEFCDWIESLPYSEIITGGDRNEDAPV